MKKKIDKKDFILQKDTTDCGVVCLQNILSVNGIQYPLEELRIKSGTGTQGTTMLGLVQAANAIGFEAYGMEAPNVYNLKKFAEPCILHVQKEEGLQHYIVLFGWEEDYFVVGDPAIGIVQLSEEELMKYWKSKLVLLLKPTDKLKQLITAPKQKWGWLFETIKKYYTPLLLSAIIGLIVSILSISTAVFSQKLVDKLLNKTEASKLYIGIFLLGVLLLGKALAAFVRNRLLIQFSREFNADIFKNFFSKLLRLPKPFFDNRKTGDMVSRLNDTRRIEQVVSFFFGDVMVHLLLLIVALITVSIYSYYIGILALIFIPLIFLVVVKSKPWVIKAQRMVMEGWGYNESNYITTINSIGILKLFNKQPYFFNQGVEVFKNSQSRAFEFGKIRSNFNFLLELAATFFFIIIIASGVFLVQTDQLKAGELIAIVQLSALVVQSAITVAMSNIQFHEAKISIDRMNEFSLVSREMAEDEEQNETDTTPLNIDKVSIKSLAYRFPGKRNLLNNVSLEATKGSITVITGKNGQGKTMLFQILQRFYNYEEGEISVNGNNLKEINVFKWRQTLGVITQNPVLLNASIAENIFLRKVTEVDTNTIINLCKALNFHDILLKFPHGYHTVLTEGGNNISGGQRQLISFIRCIIHQPQFLLLDEPTASMDKDMEQRIVAVLNEIKRYCTILLITHNKELLQAADRLYELQNGVLIEKQINDSFIQKEERINQLV